MLGGLTINPSYPMLSTSIRPTKY